MDADFAHQVELARFPAGVQVSSQVSGPDLLLRAEQGSAGAELLLTAAAIKMYGEGPSVFMALSRLKHAAEQGLPPLHPDGTFERLVFQGD